MTTTTKIEDPQVAQYVGAVAAALDAAGFAPTTMFAEYVDLCDNPDYVVRATLAGGTVADLLWDTLSWKLIVYPRGGSNVHDDVLTGLLTDQEDAQPETVARLARPKLTEAARRWATEPAPTTAEKCAGCHLFVEPNTVTGPGIAAYVHLHRGDEADEALDGSHEARPSGEIAALSVWRKYGPPEMRARFVDQDADPAGEQHGGGWVGTPESARDEGGKVTYRPWTNGWAVGFRCERDNGDVEYVYLNPSTTDGEPDEGPNVFAYVGADGHPGNAHTAHFYDVFRSEGERAAVAVVAVTHDHDALLPCYTRCRGWGAGDRARVLGGGA